MEGSTLKSVLLRLLPAALVLSGLGVFVGCADPTNVSLDIEWEPAELSNDADTIELSLFGSCDAQTLGTTAKNATKHWTLKRGESIPNLGSLGSGMKGLYARGFSGACEVVAAGCVDFAVKKGGRTNITLILSGQTCEGGDCGTDSCGTGSDGGKTDACEGASCVEEDSSVPVDASIDSGPQGQTLTKAWTADFGAGCPFDLITTPGDSASATCNSSGLIVTSAGLFQRGAAYSPETVTFNADTSFNASFTMLMNFPTADNVADGLVFVIRKDTAPTLGHYAGGMGYAASPNDEDVINAVAVAPSVGVEFDMFSNGVVFDWSNSRHVAILRDGKNGTHEDHLAADDYPLVPDQTYYVWVDYDGLTNVMKVFINTGNTKPSLALLEYEIDIPTIIGGTHVTKFGFTGATGGYAVRQNVLAMDVKIYD